MPASTTIYAFQKPTVGGDSDTWGGASGLNGNLDEMDVLFASIATTGSSNAYVLTSGLSLAGYATGQTFRIRPNFTNTGAATINVDGLGAKSLTKAGATALASGDLTSGRIYTISYDGTQFQVMELVAIPALASVYQPLDGDLTAIAALSTNGVPERTGTDTWAIRTDVVRTSQNYTITGTWTWGANLQVPAGLYVRLGTNGTNDYYWGKPNATDLTLFRDASPIMTFVGSVASLPNMTLQADIRPLTTTSGTFTTADANCVGILTGGVTINASVLSARQAIGCLAGGSARTITRGTVTSMFLAGTNVASATLPANTFGGIVALDANTVYLTGAWQ